MRIISRSGLVALALATGCATTLDKESLESLCANGQCGPQPEPEPDAGMGIAGEAGEGGGGSSNGMAGSSNGGSMMNGGAGSGGGGTGGMANGGAGSGGGGMSNGGGGSGGGGSGGGGSGGGGSGGGGSGGGGSGGGGNGGGGSGGNPSTSCPAKTTWTETASEYCGEVAMCADPNGPFPPANATDPDATSRFSSGKGQAGDEWIQINFGDSSELDGITIITTNADYTREYEVRLSDTSGNMGAPVIASGMGAMGTITINFQDPEVGQYLLISQTGVDAANWWSIHDLNVDCVPP